MTAKHTTVFLCQPIDELADRLIAGLDSKRCTANGNRCSDYYALAQSCTEPKQEISVCLIENLCAIEGTPYYTIHFIDDVSGTDCEIFDTEDLTKESLVKELNAIVSRLPIGYVVKEPEKGDPYKVKQLQKMLAHETSETEEHYGAHLSHWWGDTKELTIDAGGLRVLIDYYSTHDTNLN